MKFLYIQCTLTIILTFKMTMALTQSGVLEKKVTLEVKDMPLEILFEKLRQDYQVKVVYGAKNFPENQMINMKANNISLSLFFDRLCNKTGLSYKVVDDYVIFEFKTPVLAITYDESLIARVTIVSEKFVPKPDTIQSDSLPIEPRKLDINEKRTIVIRELTTRDSISLPSPSQIKRSIFICNRTDVKKPRKGSSYRVAINTSFDHHLFKFNSLPDKNQEYRSELCSSFGSLFSIHLQKKILIGIGFTYSSKRFTFHRNFRMLNLNDAVSIPDVTSLSCTYMEIPFGFEYRIVRYKKLKVHLAPGINTAFLFDKKETTTYLTQGKPETEYFINQTNSFLWGPQVAFRVEYPIVKSLGFFISPRYIHYNKSVNDATMHSGTDLIRFQAGIQLDIKKS